MCVEPGLWHAKSSSAGCAGPKFPFQEKQGQKEKPKKEGKQLAHKNK